MTQKTYTAKEFAAEVARRAGRNFSYWTLKCWRKSRYGQPPKFPPAYYEQKSKAAIYTEEQIPVAVALLGAKYSSDANNLFVTNTGNNTGETDGSEDDSEFDDVPAIVPDVDSDDDDELIDSPADEDKQARVAEAKKIFDLLYCKIPAGQFSYLIKFSGGMQCYSFEIADEKQRHEMARKAIELSDSGVNIWHAVNPVCVEPHYEFDEKKKRNVLKRGDDDVVSYQTAVIVDIDIRSEAHKSDNLAANFDEAKSFLPFAPSILINTGHGVQAYYIWATPLAITDDNREEIKRRNNLLIEIIRAKANGKTIDGVGDLPRIFRTPGTFNYKLGKDNASLCRLVEVNDIHFTPADIDERLNALATNVGSLFAENSPARADDGQAPTAGKIETDTPPDDSPELKEFRIRHMLPYINVVDGEYEKWLGVGFALFNEGMQLSDWEQWSRTQPEFKDGECESKWAGFSYRPDGISVASLYQWAVQGGYDEKEVQREWYQLHPELSNSRRKHYQSSSTTNDADTAAQIKKLKADLEKVSKELADFDAQKTAGLEKLRNVEVFDSATVFSEDILDAAAFAYRDDKKKFSDFKRAIVNYGNAHREEKISVNDWLADVKEHALELARRQKDLLTRRNEIKAQIDALTFAAGDETLAGLTIPAGYSVNSRYGILKAAGDEMITVCRRPVIITGETYSVDGNIYKTKLAYQTSAGKWKNLPATENATVFDKSKLVGLANVGLPVTSSNAKMLLDYLDAFAAVNEHNLLLTYQTSRGGWYTFNGSEMFVDNRRQCVFTNDEDRQVSVVVDTSRSQFANALRTVGTIEEWKRAYLSAKPSPIARLVVAAAVAPPLLKILNERNFMLYIVAPTTAGKTTALMLAASAVGSEKIIRSFDATKNGLIGAAADVNDFAFLIDEKQVADGRLKEQLTAVLYSLANGVGRTKQNRNSVVMDLPTWRTIVTATGETQFLPDNATAGADTRLMTVATPEKILDADTCKIIRDIIKENYGLIFPLVVDKILEIGSDTLRGIYGDVVDVFKEHYPKMLNEHRRYLAVLTLADALLHSALGLNKVTTADGKTLKAIEDATLNAKEIFKLIPTTAELSSTARARAFVRGFIGQNQSRFIGGNVFDDKITKHSGKIHDGDGFTYIATFALKEACKAESFDYRKLVADLVADEFFVPADKPKKNRRTPTPTVQKKIGEVNMECYRIRNEVFDGE